MNLYFFIPLIQVLLCLIVLAVLYFKGKKIIAGLPPGYRELLQNNGIALLAPFRIHSRSMNKLRSGAKSLREQYSLKEHDLLQKASVDVIDYMENRQKKPDEFRKAIEGIIHAVSLVVGSRDQYTASHQRRVAELARTIAVEIGLTDWQVTGIYVAGLLHDVGKVSVPTEILTKPGKINASEFDIIKNHCRVGYDILRKINFPWPVTTAVLQHHERLDGSGYPQGLSGNDIILEARILGVADVVEAMSSHRPYRPALGLDIALEEISRGSGILYDADIVAACLKLLRKNKIGFDEIMAAAETHREYVLEAIN